MDKIKKFKIILITFISAIILAIAVGFFINQANRNRVAEQLREAELTKAATPNIEVRPKSGKWNYPEAFILKNTSSKEVTITWFLDCWDDASRGKNSCSDTAGTKSLSPGEEFEKGLGQICSKWQLDYTEVIFSPPITSADDNRIQGSQWKTPGMSWGGIAEASGTCSSTPNPSPTPTNTPQLTSTPTSTPKVTKSPTASPKPSKSPTASPSPTQTSTTSPSASPTATPSVSASASSTASPSPSATATSTPNSTTSSTPRPTSTPSEVASATTTPNPTSSPDNRAVAAKTDDNLPAAGIEDYTIILFTAAASFILLGILLSKKRKRY